MAGGKVNYQFRQYRCFATVVCFVKYHGVIHGGNMEYRKISGPP